MNLYRTASSESKINSIGSFWSSNREYPQYIHKGYPLYRAVISSTAKIKTFKESTSKPHIQLAKRQGYDAAKFPIWDFQGYEYVILNTNILHNIVKVK